MTVAVVPAPAGTEPRHRGDAVGGAVAFTDLVGFTEFTARHGDRSALALLDRHERLATSVLPPDARVVKNLGDGLLLWFTDSAAAVDACLRVVDGFGLDGEPGLRAGLHWGRPVRRGTDLVGHAVNVAARLAQLAAPGELVVSQDVWVRAAGRLRGVRFERHGRVALRGVPEPVQVLTARPTPSFFTRSLFL